MRLTSEFARTFELHIRCESCLKESVCEVNVPAVPDAPADVDELVESSYLSSLAYCCGRCEGVIGRLFAVNRREVLDSAA